MQTDYWDQVAEDKLFRHPLNVDVLQSLVSQDGRIIDLGCGYGRVLEELRLAGYTNLLGLDTSGAMIARANREHPQLDFRQIAGFDIGEPSSSADAVILFTVLTCVPANDDQASLIAECKRVLRRGGILYVSDLYLNQDFRNAARYDRYEKQFGVRGVFQLEDGGIMRHHDEKWMKSLLAGFEQLRHDEFTVQTMNNNTSRAFQYFGRKVADR